MYVLYYASMLRCWHLIWILVRTDHPCLGVGCHTPIDLEATNLLILRWFYYTHIGSWLYYFHGWSLH
jgi:hypothetical protein